MDYSEEQNSELEALEAIYPAEYRRIGEDPVSFRILLKSESSDGLGAYKCVIKFTYPETYPDIAPTIEIVPEEELEDDDYYEEDEDKDESYLSPDNSETLLELLNEQAEENLGMVMIFTLASFAVDWMSKKYEMDKNEADLEIERERIEQEEEEKKRFEGTRVTVQNFIAWKKKFDEEMALLEAPGKSSAKEKEANKKLTGKELFLSDNTLIESDLQIEDGNEDYNIVINEDLFDELDDELELCDDDLADDLGDLNVKSPNTKKAFKN